MTRKQVSKFELFIGARTDARKSASGAISVIAAAVLFAVSLSSCKRHQDSQDTGRYPSAIEQLAVRRERLDPAVESRTRGHQLYLHYCQICHGPQAQGNGFNAAMLEPPPRNFADEAFWGRVDDAYLQELIARGGKAMGRSALMPPWGRTVNEEQIQDVISFLRTVPKLAEQAAEAEAEKSE